MLSTTFDAVKAVLKADPSIPTIERNNLLAALRGNQQKSEPATPNHPRLLRRAEAAHRGGMSVRTLDKLCKEGALRKVKLPGRKRSAGILESDLNTLLAAQ